MSPMQSHISVDRNKEPELRKKNLALVREMEASVMTSLAELLQSMTSYVFSSMPNASNLKRKKPFLCS